jgi:protein arginine kinase
MSWMNEQGPNEDVVFSSRVRLARNLSGRKFPSKLDQQSAEQIIEDIKTAARALPNNQFEVKRINQIGTKQAGLMLEKHLISKELFDNRKNGATMFDEQQLYGAMINEEDHIRIQSILSGYQLEEALEMSMTLDDAIEQSLHYAYDERLGYLTTCPTNAGTGLRASVMMHLPGLVASKSIMAVLEALAKIGITVRGLYGEGTKAQGDIFQISNQVTMGMNEQEIVSGLKTAVGQIIERERVTRELLRNKNGKAFQDKLWRAYGILTNARLLSAPESLDLLSKLRLGISMNVFTGITYSDVNALMTATQNMHLLEHFEIDTEEIQSQNLSELRATRVWNMMKKLNIH